MSQQLNLLPQDKGGQSPAIVASLIIGAVVLTLLATWGVKHRMLEVARTDEAASAAQLKEVTAKLSERFRSRSAQLSAEIDALKPRAAAAEQVLILAAALGKSDGYSPYFSVLATVREDGVWLTGAVVSQVGKSLQLSGHSLDKDGVIRYTQRLNTAFADSGIQLTALDMTSQPFGAVGANDKSNPNPLTAIKFTLQ